MIACPACVSVPVRVKKALLCIAAVVVWQVPCFALVSVAVADGYIGGFETKYELNFWRPVTAIRAGDMDGNDRTAGDPLWSSFLNTPALPDYTSTHSVAGGAGAAVMCRFFRTDNLAFTLPSGPRDAILLRFLTGRHGER